MSLSKSITSDIKLGMHDHLSIGHIDGNGKFGGGTFDIDVISSGPVNPETGMIIDLTKYKEGVRRAIGEEFEHSLIVGSGAEELAENCRKKGMHLIETPHGSIEGLPIVIFDKLRTAIHEPLKLSSIRFGAGPKKTWNVWSDEGRVSVDAIKRLKKRNYWECTLIFSHRIIGLGKCENPHSHSWTPKIQFDRELSPEEYEIVTGEIHKKLQESWAGKGVFHTGDDFGLSMSKKKHIKELSSPPTTEIISMMMIREIEKVLRATGINVRLIHFELWETPTNFVTT